MYTAPGEWQDLFKKAVHRRINKHLVFLGLVETTAVFEDDRLEQGQVFYCRIEDDGVVPK